MHFGRDFSHCRIPSTVLIVVTHYLPLSSEPEHQPHPESTPVQAAVHSEEKEDVKPEAFPITQTQPPGHHLGEEHYHVLVVKTEEASYVAHRPVVIAEEQSNIEQQMAADDELPVQQRHNQLHIEQSNDQETVVECVAEHEMEERLVIEDNEEHSQEETETSTMYKHGDIVENDQNQEEIAEGLPAVQERLPLERDKSFPVKDASVSWMQEPTTTDVQEPDSFYTPEEQSIPQSQPCAEEYQEESRESEDLVSSSGSYEPWVMVDYPSAQEQENFVPFPDAMTAPQDEPVKPNEEFVPEALDETVEQEYHNDDEEVDVDEEEEPPAVEVCCFKANLHNSNFLAQLG